MAKKSPFSCTYQKKALPLQRKGQNTLTFCIKQQLESARCSNEYNMTTLTPEQKEALMADLRSFDDTLRVDDFGESK